MVDSPYADEMVVRRPPLVPNEQAALSQMDRDLIGKSIRLELALDDRYQVRRDLEAIAGAVQRALALTHQPEMAERSVLMEVKWVLMHARIKTSRRYIRPKPGQHRSDD